jgi:di/tricarboxylate transporter
MHLVSFGAVWMRNHLSEISFSITAILFVVGGPLLNSGMKSFTQKLHWLFRYGIFVLLTTVGYGLLTNYSLHFMRGFLIRMNDVQLLIFVFSFHLFMAWLLKRDRAI